jgi:E3 ubiquitin-protein ligase UBR7
MIGTREEQDENCENTNNDSITLKEFLMKQREMELKAAAELPFRFDKCSAELGPLRQNLHICHNCPNNFDGKPVAFCYACAITCHNFDPESLETVNEESEDVLDAYGDDNSNPTNSHLIEEIWARRNFICDCPSTGHCKLLSKIPENFKSHKNSYHRQHNFTGRYCFCNGKGWAAGDSTMYQCEVCEDWYHDSCVARDHQGDGNYEIPSEDSFSDFICRGCVIKYKNFFSKIIPNSLIFTVPASSKISSAPLFLVNGWREELCKQAIELNLNLDPGIGHLIKDEEPVYEQEIDSDAKESLYDRKTRHLIILDIHNLTNNNFL